MFCNRCGAKKGESLVYCPQCGYGTETGTPGLTLAQSPTATKCAVCQTSASEPTPYCTHCGSITDLVARAENPLVPDTALLRILLSTDTWIQGAIGAGVAAASVWVVSLVLKVIFTTSSAGKALFGLFQTSGVDANALKPGVGLIYALLHQVSAVLDIAGEPTKSGGAADSLGATLHVPLLLGLLIVALALRIGGQFAMTRGAGESASTAAIRAGIGVAIPYALISLIMGWIGSSSFTVNSLLGKVTGSLGPDLWSLFLNSLVLALLLATLGAYRPTKERDGVGGFGYWLPSLRIGTRSIATGLALTLVLSLVLGFFGARSSSVGGVKFKDIQREMVPVSMGPAAQLGGTALLLTVAVPVAVVDAHALAHFVPLSVRETSFAASSSSRAGNEGTTVDLFRLPKGSRRFWLLLLVPLFALTGAGFDAARKARALGTPAIVYGAVTGAVHAVGLALLVSLAQITLSLSALGGRLGFTAGADFGSAIGPILLLSVLLGGAGGYLSTRAGGLAR